MHLLARLLLAVDDRCCHQNALELICDCVLLYSKICIRRQSISHDEGDTSYISLDDTTVISLRHFTLTIAIIEWRVIFGGWRRE